MQCLTCARVLDDAMLLLAAEYMCCLPSTYKIIATMLAQVLHCVHTGGHGGQGCALESHALHLLNVLVECRGDSG